MTASASVMHPTVWYLYLPCVHLLRSKPRVPSPPLGEGQDEGQDLKFPLTLTLSPEVRGGEGTCSEVPWGYGKTYWTEY